MKTIFTLFLCSLYFICKAQNLIAVEHSGVSKFYSTLDSAVNAALTGDNVYVPGGNFTLSVPINKGFNLIGVGYNPDSTSATGFTQVTSSNNTIYVITGADNGSVTGIYFYGASLFFGNSASNQTVNNYTISRCRVSGSLNLGYVSSTNSTNLVFNENIFESSVSGSNIQNCVFSKNIFNYNVYYFLNGNQFLNNIFLYHDGYMLEYIANSTFKNNIYLFNYSGGASYFSANSGGNIFYNNLFIASLSTWLPGTDINSIYGVAQSSIFTNQTGNAYDYKQNYHLKTTCSGHNYGTDGTDLGVYGTATPWKEGGVPYNPHIQFQSIATQTDGNGNLSVNIKVAAQKN